MRSYGTLFTWKVIDHEMKRIAERKGLKMKAHPVVVKRLAPARFALERTTVWRFPKRGDWAVHDGKYRGNWAPQVPRNMILHYTRKGDTVLDPFVGSGTTLIECATLQRRGIGVDISPHAVSITKGKLRQLRKEIPNLDDHAVRIFRGDARRLSMVSDDSVDLVCGQPPYANAIKYTADVDGDLSAISSLDDFLDEMRKVASELHRVLKKGRRCSMLVGDVRRNKMVFPLGFRVMDVFLDEGFELEDIIVKEQYNDGSTRFYAARPWKVRFRFAHEYLFVFRKPLNGSE
jgi:DNA modification methylase